MNTKSTVATTASDSGAADVSAETEAGASEADTQTLRAARAAYFAASGFDESTYTDAWVDLSLGPIPFRFPNTAGRKRTVPLHDLHHALTGYSAKLGGERLIAAFEIGGGMRRHWDGWFLNLLTMTWGTVIGPRSNLGAFVRGRRSRNLYQQEPEPGLLDRSVQAVCVERGIAPADEPQSATAGEMTAFVGWFLASCVVSTVGYALIPFMFVLGLWGALQSRADRTESAS